MIKLSVNGRRYSVDTDPDTPLLYILRNNLIQNGPKSGCGDGQCGACMVLLDGRAVMSCLVPVSSAEGKAIVTLDGLSEGSDTLHPVQQAFLDEQAAQCGYCTNGMIMSAVALLDRNNQPDDREIREALQINLCRCGSQSRVIRAVKRARQTAH